jgi:GNAT superfamily N-acetyltransferase
MQELLKLVGTDKADKKQLEDLTQTKIIDTLKQLSSQVKEAKTQSDFYCNSELPYDLLNPSTLRRITFGDPNFEPDLALVALDGGGPVGFAAGARRVREPVGRVDPSAGWIKVIAGTAGRRVSEADVLDSLCGKIVGELKRLGAKTIRVSDFASWHISPGIDVRYETILEVLERRGYSKVGEAVDYLIGLRAFSVPRRILRLREDLERQGMSIAMATSADYNVIRSWVGEKFGAGWAYEVAASLDNSDINRSGTLIAKDGGTGGIIGFSTHGALEPHWFGPIGVDPSRRKSGVGSALLFESLRLMRLNGIAEAVIPWTSHLFFYTQVPGIVGIRHYHTMGKRLDQ